MPKNSLNVSLKGADDIFSTEESRQEQQREQVQQIPIGELFPFKNHPFKVLDARCFHSLRDALYDYFSTDAAPHTHANVSTKHTVTASCAPRPP